VVGLNDEIIEMIVAPQTIAALFCIQPHRLIVVPVRRVLAPGVLRTDGADGQKRPWSAMAVGAPPQPPWPECAVGRAAVALALVGPDATAPERNLDGLAAGGQPAAAALTCRGADCHSGERPASRSLMISL
jgi:hypothetical protein